MVCAQVLWKISTENHHFSLSQDFLFSGKFISFLLSWQVLAGFALYAVATILYMNLLAGQGYSQVQSLVIPLSLVFAFTLSRFFFSETISVTNWVGLAVLIVGVILATKQGH